MQLGIFMLNVDGTQRFRFKAQMVPQDIIIDNWVIHFRNTEYSLIAGDLCNRLQALKYYAMMSLFLM